MISCVNCDNRRAGGSPKCLKGEHRQCSGSFGCPCWCHRQKRDLDLYPLVRYQPDYGTDAQAVIRYIDQLWFFMDYWREIPMIVHQRQTRYAAMKHMQHYRLLLDCLRHGHIPDCIEGTMGWLDEGRVVTCERCGRKIA